MKISKENALALWEEEYRNAEYAEDFDGALMYKYAYGDSNYSIVRKIFTCCGIGYFSSIPFRINDNQLHLFH